MQIYYIIRVHPVSGSANYQSKLSQSILKHTAFWDILSSTITDSFLQAKRTLYDPETTSQIHTGLSGVRTWSHTRWCYFLISHMHLYTMNLTLAFEENICLHLGNSYKNDALQIRSAENDKMSLPFSIPLRSSNDARPKMSDQLAVLLLTFNWQIGKQTHTEEHVVQWMPDD